MTDVIPSNQWVSVKDRMPETQRMVILATPCSQRGPVDYGFLDFADHIFKVQSMAGWDDVRDYGGEVTHWMPMPQPPGSEVETSPDRDCACNLVTGCRVKGGESLLKGYRCRAPETSAKCATHATEYRLIGTLPCPWCVIDELKRNRDALAAETRAQSMRDIADQYLKEDQLANGAMPINMRIAVAAFARWFDRRGAVKAGDNP